MNSFGRSELRKKEVMAERTRTEGTQDREQFAAYAAELTGELAAAARRHRLDALAYLLDMAQLEAKNACSPRLGEVKTKVAH